MAAWSTIKLSGRGASSRWQVGLQVRREMGQPHVLSHPTLGSMLG
jgi:hypothetical protein